MANLLGQNIGTNYKGILNLNTLNGNLSGTLQAVTDGDGNASPLQLSTTEVSIPTGVFNVDAQLRFQGTIYNTTDDIVKFGGKIRVQDFIQFNGGSNTFPMLKRNGAGLEVRLADDSGYATIRPGNIIVGGNNDQINASTNSGFMELTTNASGISLNVTSRVNIGFNGVGGSASAILQVDSTTKGFLPPRMTTTERDAIASPAAGLVVYNTTTNVLNFYNGSAWGAI